MSRAGTRAAPRSRPSGSSRSSKVALDVTVVLAVLLPLLTGGAVLLTREESPSTPDRAPTETALGAVSVICPSVDGPAQLSTASGASGPVVVGERTVPLTDGEVTTVRSGGPVVVEAEDDLAPGLVAGRFAAGQAAECADPDPDQWFTGVGAGAGHSSVLELVNPDNGPALADVVVTGRAGTVDVPRLRGVSVPGNGSVRLDLAAVVPRRDELSLRVTTQRGRVAASVLDRVDQLGAGGAAEDWLPGQEPARQHTLLGVPDGAGSRTLVLANDGDSEVRVGLRVVDEASTYTPEGLEEVRVAPQSVARVSLGQALRGPLREGGLGLAVEATGPVTATLRSYVGGDLSHAVPATPVAEPTTLVVPQGRKRLVLAGARSTGLVTVVARDDAGEELATKRVEVSPQRGFVVGLPAAATLLTVTPERTPVLGAVLAPSGGTAVVRLRELVRSGLVPDVRPGLP